MTTPAWSLALFLVYLAWTEWLARRGAAGKVSFAAFAAGRAELGPFMTALVLTACHVSTATFSINPGLVYADGLTALIGLSLPLTAGITAALALLGPAFRATSIGPDGAPRALTMPQWIGERFGSPGLRRVFSLLVLALFFYLVMVVVGAAYVVANTAAIPLWAAVSLVVGLVLLGTARGGAGKQAQANAARGAILMGAAVILGGGVIRTLFLDGGAGLERLRAAEPGFFALVRPGSKYFGDAWSAYVFPFAIGFALGCQPNILGKVLFLRDRAAVVRASLSSGALFLSISVAALAVGLAARADLGAGLQQDQAASLWIAQTFPPPLAALVGVALIAGAVSTLDGLFLAIGTTIAHDLLRPLLLANAGEDADRKALRLGQIATVGVGVLAIAFSVDPPPFVWVTGAMGAYAMVAAACPAVIAGCFDAPRAQAGWIFAAAAVGPLVHVGLFVAGVSKNPNATGTVGLVAALAIVAAGTIKARMRVAGTEATPLEERV